MKKVLFIIKWYPPRRSANVLCDIKIMNALLKSGDCEVHCLVSKYGKQPIYEKKDGFYVHRMRKGALWNLDIWAQSNEDKKIAKLFLKVNKVFLRIRQFFTIPIYPCDVPLQSLNYARKAVALQKKEKFDIVLAEHNGFESLYAGYRVKKKFPDVKFIPLLWDPLDGNTLAKYLPQKYAHKKMLNCENRLLSKADKIITMDSAVEYHRRHSKNKSYYDRFGFLGIPGIIEHKVNSDKHEYIQTDKINVVFTGLLNLPMRDPEPIINIFNETKYAEKLNLIFICAGNGKTKLNRLKDDFKGVITIGDYMDSKLLPSVYGYADILLNLGGDNPNMTPSKIFEYMSYGKPIVSTYYTDRESSVKYFNKYRLAITLDLRKDIKENIRLLDVFINDNLGKEIVFEEVAKTFRNNTPDVYINEIRQLF